MAKLKFNIKAIHQKTYLGSTVFWMSINIVLLYFTACANNLIELFIETKPLATHPFTQSLCYFFIFIFNVFGLMGLAALILGPLLLNLATIDEKDGRNIKSRPAWIYFLIGICLILTCRFWVLLQTPLVFQPKEFVILVVASVLYSIINTLKIEIARSEF
jgi:hypothetical protein